MSDAISEGIKVVAEGLEIASKVQDEKNAPDVKDAAKAQDEADARAREIKAVAERDLETLRRNLAE